MDNYLWLSISFSSPILIAFRGDEVWIRESVYTTHRGRHMSWGYHHVRMKIRFPAPLLFPFHAGCTFFFIVDLTSLFGWHLAPDPNKKKLKGRNHHFWAWKNEMSGELFSRRPWNPHLQMPIFLKAWPYWIASRNISNYFPWRQSFHSHHFVWSLTSDRLVCDLHMIDIWEWKKKSFFPFTKSRCFINCHIGYSMLDVYIHVGSTRTCFIIHLSSRQDDGPVSLQDSVTFFTKTLQIGKLKVKRRKKRSWWRVYCIDRDDIIGFLWLLLSLCVCV